MANRPTHTAIITIDPPEGSDRNAKARWIEVGACWQHRDGQGVDLIYPPASASPAA
jgi:hypothetical protein